MARLRIVLSALLLVAWSASAFAEVTPEVELVSGAAVPVGGSSYQDDFGSSLKLGVRAVLWQGNSGLGLELAADGMDATTGASRKADVTRVRVLGGVRVETLLAERLQLFARVLAGVDHFSGKDSLLSGSDSALALELGVGARITLGRFSLGAQVGLPLAFYELEPGEISPDQQGEIFVVPGGWNAAYLRTTTVDLDCLGTLAVTF